MEKKGKEILILKRGRGRPRKPKPLKKHGVGQYDKKRPGNPKWTKGISGNPTGRPPNQKLIPDNLREIGNCPAPPEIITELGRKVPSINFTQMNMFQAYCWRVYINAVLEGDGNNINFIAERTEGKIKQPLDLGFDTLKVQAALNLTAASAPEPTEEGTTSEPDKLPPQDI